MMGSAFSASFWKINWPLIAVVAILFVAFNSFYCINRRLFLLLEKEDWPALIRYLEDAVIQKGKYSPRLVRLLANCYLVLSDSASVMSLENKASIVKPSLVDANVLVFGTARILGKDISGAVRFFAVRKDTAKPKVKEWVCWYYGFSLLLDRRYEEAGEEFSLLARLSKDGVIAGLSSYFLSETIARVLAAQNSSGRAAQNGSGRDEKGQEYREIALLGKERVQKALPARKHWNQEISRLSTEIHAAALSKYMEETGLWIYK
jgi:hypothetical protein